MRKILEYIRNFLVSKNKFRRAFSLIELSMVLLIIGIIIGGVTQSTRLVAQFKLSSARSLTQSSPVPSIPDLGLWLETTLDNSLSVNSPDDATRIDTWRDIKPSSYKNNATSSGNA